ELAAGGAVAGIVETGDLQPPLGTQLVEAVCLGAGHFRAETAEPEQPRLAARAAQQRDLARIGSRSDEEARGDRDGRDQEHSPGNWKPGASRGRFPAATARKIAPPLVDLCP